MQRDARAQVGLFRHATMLLVLVGLGVTSACALPFQRQGSATPTPLSPTSATTTTATGGLHVQGTQIVDASRQSIILRGAMMESAFAYIKRWQSGQDPTQILNSRAFQAMKSWHMNTLRTNISYWIYQINPSTYMTKLDQVIRQANQAGLYVVIDFHDDLQSGSPYGDAMMHPETLTFWTIIAGHFKANPMVLFDPINEPRYPDWQTWLQGNGRTIVGFQKVIHTIRATGAQQPIVVEPGITSTRGWDTIGNDLPQDVNLIYSKHDYASVVSGNPTQWDAEWGPILNHYPIYYGEWAALPHPNHPVFCQGMTSTNADQIVGTFLAYMQSRHASWTAWDFEPVRLIQDYTSFIPTSMQSGAPWSCESPSSAQAGMGQDVKQFLANNP